MTFARHGFFSQRGLDTNFIWIDYGWTLPVFVLYYGVTSLYRALAMRALSLGNQFEIWLPKQECAVWFGCKQTNLSKPR